MRKPSQQWYQYSPAQCLMSRDLKDVVQTAAGQRVALWLEILYDWKYCRKEKPRKDPLWQKGIEPALRLFARVKEIPETPFLPSKHCNEKCYHYREQKYEAKGKERKEIPLSHWDFLRYFSNYPRLSTRRQIPNGTNFLTPKNQLFMDMARKNAVYLSNYSYIC